MVTNYLQVKKTKARTRKAEARAIMLISSTKYWKGGIWVLPEIRIKMSILGMS